MKLAIQEAEQALMEDEVPVGCIIVKDDKVIGKGHNRVETLKDPTAHAEILAITAAAATLNNWRLLDSTLYTTVEPCLMCTGAIILARLKRVVYGTKDEKFGCLESKYTIERDNRFNHRFEVTGGVLSHEATNLLKKFFKQRRLKSD